MQEKTPPLTHYILITMTSLNLIIFILVLAFMAFLTVSLILRYTRFKGLLQYINIEIQRNTGEAQEFWKKEKQHLIRAFLSPFYRF